MTYRRHCVVALLVAMIGGLISPGPAFAGGRPSVRIAPTAQCHGTRCFVVVSFANAPRGTAVVTAGSARRTVRVRPGASQRVVEFRKRALRAPVTVELGRVSRQRQVERRRAAVNLPSDPCATLAPVDVYLSVGPPNSQDEATNLAAFGTLNAAVMYVDFPDAVGTGDPRQAFASWIDTSIDHMRTTSYGRFDLDIVASTADWVRMPSAVDSYGFGDGLTYEEHLAYLQDAIDETDAQLDFSNVSLVILIVPPTALLFGSQAFRGLPGTLSTDEGVIGPAVTFGGDAAETAGVVFPHEIGHTLGLPDLYAFQGDVHRFIGKWDYMGNIFEPPTDLFAWQRTRLGWLDERQTLCAGDGGATYVRLAPLYATGGTKAAFVRTGDTTGLMVENRQVGGNDGDLCVTGALIYTLDSSVPTGQGPVLVAGGDEVGDGCGIGSRSDAPLEVGESRTVDEVTVTVLGQRRGVIEVRIDA